MNLRLHLQPLKIIKHKFVQIQYSGRSNRRIIGMLLLLLCWLFIVFGRLTDLMLVDSPAYAHPHYQEENWVEGRIPPLRGRILDRNGTPLAESVRQLALQWRVPSDPGEALTQLRQLKTQCPVSVTPETSDILQARGEKTIVKSPLRPREVEKLNAFCEQNSRLRIITHFIRKYYPKEKTQRILGRVISKNGITVGVSGMEKRHDTLLRGCPGIYRVKIDDDGQWVPGTWTQKSELRAGYDVYLPLDIAPAELVKRR